MRSRQEIEDSIKKANERWAKDERRDGSKKSSVNNEKLKNKRLYSDPSWMTKFRSIKG